MSNIDDIKELVIDSLKSTNYTLYSLSLQNEKDGLFLHITVDRDDPISLDDIVEVSNLINNKLDSSNLLDIKYTLDISSLGAEKPIDMSHFEKYIGKYISIHLVNAIKGFNYLEATLNDVKEGLINVSYMEKTRKISLDIDISNIDKARLAIKL